MRSLPIPTLPLWLLPHSFFAQKMIKTTTGIVLLTLTTALAFGQKTVTRQSLIWYGLTTSVEFNEKWYLQNEFQERHYINPFAQHQFLMRSRLHRVLGQSGWETSAGICLFLQYPNDPLATVKLRIPELRPHIEFAYQQKFEKLTINHRYRVEARFFHNTNNSKTALEHGYRLGAFRFRYRLQATIPIVQLIHGRYLRLKLSDEIHLNAGKNIITNPFDQNRIYGALNCDMLPNLSIEVGYLNWFQQTSSGEFYDRDILNLSLLHKIKPTFRRNI